MLLYDKVISAFLNIVPPLFSSQYWKEVVQDGIGCTLGSLVAIAASYGIYLLANRQNRTDKRKEIFDTLLYFRGMVNNIIHISKEQVTNIENYIESINANNLNLPLLSFVPMYSLKRIVEGESMDRILIAYIRHFPGESSVKEFNSLVSAIEYLYSQFLQLPEEVRLSLNYDHERKVEYQKLFRDSFSLLGGYMLGESETSPSAASKRVKQIMDEFSEHHSDNYDLLFFHQYFFEPIHGLMIDLLSSDEKSPVFIQLAHMTREGKQLFNYITSENKGSSQNMLELIPDLKEAIRQLERHSVEILKLENEKPTALVM